jgi:hypothetical protein
VSGVRVDVFLADAVAVEDGRLHARAAGWDVLHAAGRVAHELEVRLEGPGGSSSRSARTDRACAARSRSGPPTARSWPNAPSPPESTSTTRRSRPPVPTAS